MVNPFIPDKMAKLTGALQGELAITGTTSAPAVNGYVRMDSSAVYVTGQSVLPSVSTSRISRSRII